MTDVARPRWASVLTALALAKIAEEHDVPALARELKHADHCHGIVIRDGEQDACGKPAVAMIDARACEDGGYWPACVYHANRYGRGRCVPLAAVAGVWGVSGVDA
jgi:hypothetical protein